MRTAIASVLALALCGLVGYMVWRGVRAVRHKPRGRRDPSWPILIRLLVALFIAIGVIAPNEESESTADPPKAGAATPADNHTADPPPAPAPATAASGDPNRHAERRSYTHRRATPARGAAATRSGSTRTCGAPSQGACESASGSTRTCRAP